VRVQAQVRAALDAGHAVVALESSVFAQGLPSPQNADAANRMVLAVERAGATPAITAVARGDITLGLEPAELEWFLQPKGVRKVSARDLGAALARREDGATTVAAALVIAHLAGVRVLATGGIGGVHRVLPGSRSSAVDESADLMELARTPMIVVCSGAKAILDLQATWERLDTLGIVVVGYKTGEFPGFYSATTGILLTNQANSAAEVVAIATAHFALGRQQAVLVVVPPPPAQAMDADLVERSVAAALSAAAKAEMHGAEVTPYLLAAVSRETAGLSMAANLALLENNSRVAAEIAVELRRVVMVV